MARMFSPQGAAGSRLFAGAVAGLMWLAGGAVWGFVLSWGRIGFDVHDWTQEGPRLDFLRRAILEGRLPLYIGTPLASTTRFLSIPDTLISPQVLLLRWLEPGPFVLANTLLLYTLGVLGLMLLGRRLNWSPFTFAVVFLLVMLNGHPVAQIAVGHSMWASAFLLPFFVLLLIELADGAAGWGWVAKMSLLQFGLYLQGGFHFVNWCLMFLIAWGLARQPARLPALRAAAAAVLVSMVRVLPAVLEFGGTARSFISGYFSVTDLVRGFVELRPPEQALTGLHRSLGWWEVDVYSGLLGLGFLVVCGAYGTARDGHPGRRSLLWPALLMAVLSLGKVYQPFSWLPLLGAERVSSRFIVVPMVTLMVLGGSSLERWLQARRAHPAVWLLLAGVTAHDLLQHARLWRLENMSLLFPVTPVDIRAEVLTIADGPYEASLILGGVVSLLALGALVGLAMRERHLARGAHRG